MDEQTVTLDPEAQEIAEELSAEAMGSFKVGNTIDTGDSGIPMVVSSLIDPGKVRVWDNRTGEESIINRGADDVMLRFQLRKRRPEDGTLCFTDKDPGIRPKAGTIKCLLHKDDPNRKLYTTMGFPICNKSNLPTPMQLASHMEHRHQMEWKTLERERTDKERKEDRQFQKDQMTSLVKLAGNTATAVAGSAEEEDFDNAKTYADLPVGTPEAPLYVSDRDRKTGAKKDN